MRKRIRRVAFHLGRWTLHVSRWTLYVLAGVLVLLAVVLTLLRVALPTLAKNKVEVEQYLSERTNYSIHIGELQTYWEGWHPGMRIQGLDIYSPVDLTRALRLGEVRLSLALLPLLWGELRVDSLVLVRPSMGLERLADGRLQVTGFGPMQAQPGSDKSGLLLWLLKQRHVVIEAGEFQWFDHRGNKQQAVYLSNINIDLKNAGNRHQLSIQSQFPPEICLDCSMTLDIRGNPFTDKSWHGRVSAKLVELKLEALPKVVREAMPSPIAGKLNVNLSTAWQDGRPKSGSGRVSVDGLQLPLTKWHTSFRMQTARADVNWKRDGKYWQLNVEDFWLGLSGPAWSAGHLRVLRGPDGTTLRLKQLELHDLSQFLRSLDIENKVLTSVKRMQPRGRLQSVTLHIAGDGKSADDYALEAKVERLQSQPFEKIPGVRGVSGNLSTKGRRGSFVLNASDVTVTAPYMFRLPINASSVSAALSWAVEDDEWRLSGENMRVVAEDGRGTGTLELRGPLRSKARPYMNLRVDFSDGNGAHASRYFPHNVMPPKLIKWLDGAIVSGDVIAGRVIFNGNLADFPFREGNGTFEVSARVRDGVFNYLPDWTPLSKGEADLLFKGPGMLITIDRAAIGELAVSQVTVSSSDLSRYTEPVVKISGLVQGSVGEALRVLRSAPAPGGDSDWTTYLNMGIGASGRGLLKLQIDIPALDPQSFAMTGQYTVSNATLQFRAPRMSAYAVQGWVDFDRLGPTGGQLQGQFLGGPAYLSVDAQRSGKQGATVLSGRGTFTAAGLLEAGHWNVLRYLEGEATWRGEIRLRKGLDQLRVDADLSKMQSHLPPPLDRPEGIADKLSLVSEKDGVGARLVSVRIGEHIGGRIRFVSQKDDWVFDRGAISLGTGEPTLPPSRGLDISASAAHVDADPWFEVFRRGEGAMSTTLLRRLRGDFDSLYLFNRKFGKFHIDVSRDRGDWNGEISGDAVQGRIALTEGRSIPIDDMRLELARLDLPEKKPQPDMNPPDPRTLPSLHLAAKSFAFAGNPIGELEFAAIHTVLGWKITQLRLVRPEMTLKLSGRWSQIEGNDFTELELEFHSSDMGESLTAFKQPEQLKGGAFDINAQLAWRGPPAKPVLPTLKGNIALSAKDGRILRVKQGAGRLFGLLDFSAIGKLFTLDFGALFGKGLPFKSLKGDISLDHGNAYTHNLYMTGVAQISFNGRMGIADRDFDLGVQVVPSLGTNIGLWAVLGPQVGLVLLSLEKIFKKQFAKGTRITYLVKGPWDNPQIERLGEVPETEGPEAPQH
jgi:uncharacterized protein (TIGR02099 family)